MTDVGGIAQEAPQWVFRALTGSATIGVVYFYYRARKDAIDAVKSIKAEYSEGLDNATLISFYQQLNLARANLFFGKKKREADELFRKVESQLNPIIKQ